jgi:hypothetical protein
VVAKLAKESNMSPAEKEARQMIADKKMQEGAEREYNKRSSVEPSKDPRDAIRGQKGYAKGGVTRADGCVSKGHTKGKMIKMAYGGKAC